MGDCYDAGLGREGWGLKVRIFSRAWQSTLSVWRVCHTLPWGLRKVLGRNALSLLLLDSDFLIVTLFSCLFLPAGSNGDINFKPKLQPHVVFFSRRLFVIITCLKFPALLCYDLLIIKFILSVNTILTLIIGCYSYHDPDGRPYEGTTCLLVVRSLPWCRLHASDGSGWLQYLSPISP